MLIPQTENKDTYFLIKLETALEWDRSWLSWYQQFKKLGSPSKNLFIAYAENMANSDQHPMPAVDKNEEELFSNTVQEIGMEQIVPKSI